MAASFSASAKAEVCRGLPQKQCCALAQCFGILLFANSFNDQNIRIITESKEFASALPKLFKKAFGVFFDVLPEQDTGGKLNFQISDSDKIHKVMDACGFDPRDTLSLHINLPLVEDDCCKTAFLKGAFLAGGSVTDPIKGYHLELSTTHQSVAREGYALMQEVLPFAPKMATRGGASVLYLKQSEQISELLALLGAGVGTLIYVLFTKL